MEYSKRMKRPLELSDKKNNKEEIKVTKRQSDEAAAGVEEFLVLLERIQKAEKCLKGERELHSANYFTDQEKCSTAMEISKSASPLWRPSFEWEDFCYGTTTTLPEKGPQRVSTSESATGTKCGASASKEKPRGNAGPSEGLDLNVESSPELTLSGGLHLFH